MKGEKTMKNSAQRAVNNDTETSGLEQLRKLLNGAINIRHRVLHREASILVNDMEVAMHRIEHQGQDASLGTIKVATWHQTSTEVRILKKALRALDALLAGDEPDNELLNVREKDEEADNLQ